MLVDVGFNREVVADCSLYWSKEEGDLANLINMGDQMTSEEIENIGIKVMNCVAQNIHEKEYAKCIVIVSKKTMTIIENQLEFRQVINQLQII